MNLYSQDGNFRLSKQIRERANSGLTIQQSNSLRKSNFNFNINRPDLSNSNKKNVELLNHFRDMVNKRKTLDKTENNQ